MNIFKNVMYVSLLFVVVITGCQKFLEIEAPPTSTSSDIVYRSDETATAVLTDIYARLSEDGIRSGSSLSSISLFASLSSDELMLHEGVSNILYQGYFRNSLTALNSNSYWGAAYRIIYVANAAIEGLDASLTITPAVKRRLLGEAKFMRAFSYFYLINLYGNAPLNLSTDYIENGKRERTSVNVVYNQIIKDLQDAEILLPQEYKNAGGNNITERIRPNSATASAMLARAYLYQGDYVNAEVTASKVINNSLYQIVPLEEVFLAASKEVIWQLQSTSSSLTNTSEAKLFVLPATGPNDDIFQFPVYLRESFKNSFSSADKRKTKWMDSVNVTGNIYTYSDKYKNNVLASPVSERVVVFRIAEQFLIRAEARAIQNKLTEAVEDLNVVHTRAGLPSYILSTKESLLNVILDERKFEFFTEWGHRWLDLKRTGQANEVLWSVKGPSWQLTDQLYPIPLAELDNNPSIRGNQNPGY